MGKAPTESTNPGRHDSPISRGGSKFVGMRPNALPIFCSSLILLSLAAACSDDATTEDAGPADSAAVDLGTTGGTDASLPDRGTAPGPDAAAPDAKSRDAGTPDSGTVGGPDAGNIIDAGTMCVDTPLYTDEDGDDYGVGASVETQCLFPEDQVAGLGRQTDDCGPTDNWRHPGAAEICGDNVDDDCDNLDGDCPTTSPASLDIPTWDCVTGTPPNNVYAWAVFTSGAPYFQDNGCFVLYEGLVDEFYVSRVNLARLNPPSNCNTSINGCTCPSLGGWPSYDRRLYAFTRRAGDPCAEIRIIDHGGEEQPVSNDCRKYLYQLHYYDIPYTYIGASVETVQRRLDLFPQVEIACASEQYPQLPFQSLLTANWQTNGGFQKK